ncbi:phosphoribosylaminoimidazolecarboxamide formyltransferase / IMP cyclohydrolase [Fervidobacterium changbaicum]|uniref:IMP cyclohydrolase n=2 Tax=Fervidobacterium TaxID=2422 RepID=A0AAI8CMF3_FERIS|nr:MULTISPECIES: IMP cyclohydrolase [Fervidobacterium]AMW33096.1 IMP cyclohydrolase [Fervidobacterium islandicum]QAV33137.1 IMP cyclohydrolase [Fervidobacterium changbaicum]SDH11322.1 phosphoribosylaminoimidazolecarboxamide formyltransferase / IMP cyclohydrolase [Fervidobacterium changbaicum]
MNIKRALISVSDKTGIVEFAKELHNRGVEIISTGGTAKLLSDSGIPVKQVSEVTGFPEILGGRVKTLHPFIFGAILANYDEQSHIADLEEHSISPIDMVVVNLYPFEEVQKQTRDEDTLIENIDIGGVALLRAAAKNHRNVVVVCDPADYPKVIKLLDSCGDVPLHDRRMFALKAFYYTMKYDSTIHKVLSELFASEKYEHMTFEKFSNPQVNYEILDNVDKRFVRLSKYTEQSTVVTLGALVVAQEPDFVIAFNDSLPVSMVNLKTSGGRICDLVGSTVVMRRLTNDMVRKLKESTFTIISYEEAEDEEYAQEALKGKELIKFTYFFENLQTEKIPIVHMVGNVMIKKLVSTMNIYRLLLASMPKNSLIAEQNDGFFKFETCPTNIIESLEKLIFDSEKAMIKLINIYTNAEVDNLFTKICGERGINIFTF